MNPIVLIPARMASTRLPGKPLAAVAGTPMIVRVWRQAMAAGIGPVVVAAAEREIAAAIEQAGGRAVLTPPDLPSGSDRIFAALQAVDPGRIIAMHPVAQRLPVHAILLCRLGAGTPLHDQRDRQKAAHLRAIATLAGETPKLRRCPVQASDWDRRAHSMSPWATIAPRLSIRSAERFATPESQRQRGLV